jgi:hypothetical protein
VLLGSRAQIRQAMGFLVQMGAKGDASVLPSS